MRTGFEVELLAPAGSDRQVLADEIAARVHGQVRRSFHADSEPSTVPGVGVFRHLSPAFDVVDAHGRPVATARGRHHDHGRPGRGARTSRAPRLVPRAVRRRPAPAARRAARRPGGSLARVLEPVAELFGVGVDVLPGGGARRRRRRRDGRGRAAPAARAGAALRDRHAAAGHRAPGRARAAPRTGPGPRLHRAEGGRGARARRRRPVPQPARVREPRPAVRSLA